MLQLLSRLALGSAHRDRDFTHMGRGIAARYQRCCSHWRPHLELTQAFVTKATQPSKKIAVLGAGRLLDVSVPRLLNSVDEVHLFDADRECARWWRRLFRKSYGKRVVTRIGDVTSALEDWSARLSKCSGSQQVEELLASLEAPIPSWVDEDFDGIISLNLLGQLPLYWRDRVLARCPEIASTHETALGRSMGALQTAHLKALTTSNRAWRVVVTDTEYYYYRESGAVWETESALFGSAGNEFAGFSSAATKKDCWLWHLAPQFVERDEYGEIHRVEAFALDPSAS